LPLFVLRGSFNKQKYEVKTGGFFEFFLIELVIFLKLTNSLSPHKYTSSYQYSKRFYVKY